MDLEGLNRLLGSVCPDLNVVVHSEDVRFDQLMVWIEHARAAPNVLSESKMLEIVTDHFTVAVKEV